MRREWNGKNHRFTLKSHINKHREAHNDMVRASEHVTYEVPNGHTRVGRLTKSITSKDPSIVSSITHINGNTTQRDDFEEAADFLLLNAPNYGGMVERSHRISGTRSRRGKDKNKEGTGSTGVEFRYHSKKEYSKLNKEQKKELSEWRRSRKGKDVGNDDKKSYAQTVAKVEAQQKVIDEMQNTIATLRTSGESSGEPERKKSTSNNPLSNPLSNPLTQRE